MALHSKFNDFQGRIACGMPLLPLRTKFEGPGASGFQTVQGQDIIDEAFRLFRVNVLFKNFEIRGPGDKVLVYLLVLISHLFKSTEQAKEGSQAQKRLGEINSMRNPQPKEKANFLAPLLSEAGNANERETYLAYVKQLKAETILRFTEKFYQKDGFPVDDFKFWAGLSRKKFMGLNFTSLF